MTLEQATKIDRCDKLYIDIECTYDGDRVTRLGDGAAEFIALCHTIFISYGAGTQSRYVRIPTNEYSRECNFAHVGFGIARNGGVVPVFICGRSSIKIMT